MRSLVLLLLTAFAVSGCTIAGSPADTTTHAVSPECERVDCETVERITAAARARGVTVIWRNPPPKPAAPERAPAGR
jgi:hypothetical protein